MIATKETLKIISEYPIGTPFSRADGDIVYYGWITGLGKNSSDELIFKVRWAHNDDESLIHPCNIRHVTYYETL